MQKVALSVQIAGIALIYIGATTSIGQTLSVTPGAVRNEENQEIEGWVAHVDQPAAYAEKTFSGFIKFLSGVKTEKRSKNVLIAEKYKVEEVCPLRGDLRAILTPTGNGTAVGITFSPGYDIHLDKTHYPQEYAKLEGLVKKFVKYHYTEFYKGEAAKTEQEINDRKKDIEKYEKRIVKLRESVSGNEQKINAGDSKADKLSERNSKSKAEADQLNQDIEKLQSEILHYQELLSQVNASMQKVHDF